jgi:non-homologous end joining protein Ku
MGDKVIPISLYPIQKNESSPFKLACPDCQGDIGQSQACKDCGKEGKKGDWLKAYPLSKTEKHVFSPEQSADLKKLEKGIIVLGQEPLERLDYKRIYASWVLDPPSDSKVIGLKKFQSQWKQIQAGLQESKVCLTVKYTDGTEKAGVVIAEDGRLILLGMRFETHYRTEFEPLPEIKVDESKIEAASKGFKGMKEIGLPELENSISAKVEQYLENPQAEIIVAKVEEPEDDSLF